MEFQKLFNESKGQPIQYKGKELKMMDRVSLPVGKTSIRVEFISTDSKWKQGVILETKGDFEINGQKLLNKIILWEHTAPKKIDIVVKSRNGMLFIYNVWETEDGTIHYWHNGGALFVEQSNGIAIYHCNDGNPDDNFDVLIFRVDYL
jgi:hypothetical protein